MADKATVVNGNLVPPGQTDLSGASIDGATPGTGSSAAPSPGDTDLGGDGHTLAGVTRADDDPTSQAAAWQWLHSQAGASLSGGHGPAHVEASDPSGEASFSFSFSATAGGYSLSLTSTFGAADPSLPPPAAVNPITKIVPIQGAAGFLSINLEFDANAANAPSSYITGWEQAATLLTQYIRDPITVNLEIGYTEYPGDNSSEGAGGASATYANSVTVTYTQLRNFLLNTGSADVVAAVNALPATTSLNGQINFVIPYAEAKVFNLIGATNSAIDGYAGFGTSIPSNAIVGVALHEFTHALGRDPGTDVLSLFRYTSVGVHSFLNGNTAPATYFSINGGNTTLADFGQTSDPSDFLNNSLTVNDPFDEFYTAGSTLQTLTTLDKTMLDMLGFGPPGSTPPPTPTLYDFYFVYNDYVTGGAKGDLYYGTVADNGSFGYSVGKLITTSLGYYYIYQSAGATTEAAGTVNDYYYYDGSATGKAYTPYYSQNYGYSPGTGLGNDLDYILGTDGGYHLFGGNTAEAKGANTLYDFYFVYNDYVTGGAKGDLYYGTVADSGALGYSVGEKITTSLGYYYIYQSAGATTQASGTVEDYYYYDGAGTGQAYIPYYAYYYGYSSGYGLKGDLDYILGADGFYHLFGGNTAEAKVTTSKADAYVVSPSTSSSPGVTTIIGAAGDVIVGGSGSDLINAMAGSSAVTVGSGPTTVWGGLGDVITGGSGTLLVDGTLGGQQIAGGPGTSTILGGVGDTISGSTGAGSSTIVGMAGGHRYRRFGQRPDQRAGRVAGDLRRQRPHHGMGRRVRRYDHRRPGADDGRHRPRELPGLGPHRRQRGQRRHHGHRLQPERRRPAVLPERNQRIDHQRRRFGADQRRQHADHPARRRDADPRRRHQARQHLLRLSRCWGGSAAFRGGYGDPISSSYCGTRRPAVRLQNGPLGLSKIIHQRWR
jgi:hypothetical protein